MVILLFYYNILRSALTFLNVAKHLSFHVIASIGCNIKIILYNVILLGFILPRNLGPLASNSVTAQGLKYKMTRPVVQSGAVPEFDPLIGCPVMDERCTNQYSFGGRNPSGQSYTVGSSLPSNRLCGLSG